jgi:hypothetical protein
MSLTVDSVAVPIILPSAETSKLTDDGVAFSAGSGLVFNSVPEPSADEIF